MNTADEQILKDIDKKAISEIFDEMARRNRYVLVIGLVIALLLVFIIPTIIF